MLASRHAGMADVATNVLHNVGNVLNSVNVSANLVSDRIRKSKCTGLGRAAGLLNQHAGDLANFLAGTQGKHLPMYLQELAAELVAERDAAITELSELRNNVEHIKQIVAMQQSYAKRGGITDTVDVRVLAEDSLRMNEGAFSRHGVAIARDFGEVAAHRGRQAQGAADSRQRDPQRQVRLLRGRREREAARYRARASRPRPKLIIAVIDTGVGIPTREPRPDLRLMASPPARRAMASGCTAARWRRRSSAARCVARAPAPGKGATFTLRLPLAGRSRPDGE